MKCVLPLAVVLLGCAVVLTLGCGSGAPSPSLLSPSAAGVRAASVVGGWNVLSPVTDGMALALTPDGTQAVTSAGDVLIVQTSEEIRALDRQTGKQRWSRPIRGPCVAVLPGPNSPIVVLEQEVAAGSSDSRPKLAWLDPATGQATASSVLDLPAGNDSRLGPLVVAGGRGWVFFAADRTAPGRDIWELLPRDH